MMSKCPICCKEIVREDGICMQCGKIYYQHQKARIWDRRRYKYIYKTSYANVYVTEHFLAHDEGIRFSNSYGFGLIGLAISESVDKAVYKAREQNKVIPTAFCYGWKDIAALIYPMQPLKGSFQSRKAGIDVRLSDGYEITILTSVKDAKALYETMNQLYQNSFAINSMNQETKMIIHNNDKAEFSGCSYCGNIQNTGSNFCTRCGQKLITSIEHPTVKYCSQCGAQIAAGILFCVKCGTKVT